MLANRDPLRDDGRAYHSALKSAGASVILDEVSDYFSADTGADALQIPAVPFHEGYWSPTWVHVYAGYARKQGGDEALL